MILNDVLDVIVDCLTLFVDKIFNPLIEYFDLGTLLLLLFGIMLSVRFLLVPLLGGKAIDMGSDSVKREKIVSNVPRLESNVPRLERN